MWGYYPKNKTPVGGGGGYLSPHPPLSLYHSKAKTYYPETPCKPQQ